MEEREEKGRMKKIPPLPRYDNVFYEGVRMLNWIETCRDKNVCIHFQNLDKGIECTALNCPCDLYEGE
uniref:Uncharacterized protein n=1 Tax=viral metagenome TaxID=1070528 RepID=A0A6M3J2X2_9ZZZZ